MNNERKTSLLRIGGALAVPAALANMNGAASAAELWFEAEPVDKSEWECKYCTFDTDLQGSVSGGLGYVTGDDFEFGNYTGYDEEGVFPVLEADLRKRGKNADFWRLDASRLGLDSRRLSAEGGRQGTYTATFDYVEIPRLVSDTARTPFRGAGGDTLTLPGDWVRANTTGGMTALDQSLRPVNLRTDRKRLGVGVEFTPASRWQYSVDFRRDEKEGLQRIGGPFLFQSAVLPQPINYTHNQVDLGVDYKAERWNLRAAYNGSFFNNGDNALRWDNPFTEPLAGADGGQMSLPPDNQSHQIQVAGDYRFSRKTHANATLSTALMTQDESFLPYTVTAGLTPGALPRSSLDGEVWVTTFDSRLVSAVTDRLTLKADLGYHERDDRTPRDVFSQVQTDVRVADDQWFNRTYSYSDADLGLSARYRVNPTMRLAAGAEHERLERPDREVDKTRENTIWAELAANPNERTAVDLRLARDDRDGTDYEQLESTLPEQNPLLRKFTLADRERNRADARLSLMPTERVDVGVSVAWTDSDYLDTQLGLRASTSTAVNADFAMLIGDNTTAHAFVTRELYENDQANSEAFAAPDWFATSEDVIDTVGVGASWLTMDDELRLGLNYVYSEATGEIAYRNEADFPDLTNRLNSVEAYARYDVTNTWAAELEFIHERYESDDWMVDGVAPDTIDEVLTMGIDSTEYENNVIAVHAKYRFGVSLF